MTAPKDINRLIGRFQENRDVYCSSQYNEAQARIEFIDPFFKALDLCHQYREILSQYKRFGDSFRHAEAINKSNRQLRPKVTAADVEFFVYLTGLFVRLALEKVRDGGAKE